MKVCPDCKSEYGGPERFCPLDGTRLLERDAQPDDPYVGATLGDRYEILECIGAGPTGRVYRCQHTLLGSVFAAKVFPGAVLNDESRVAAFRRTAARSSRLNDPHFVSVHDFGRGEGDDQYLVTDLVEGRSLAALLRETGAMDPRRALPIGLQAAAALERAHIAGLVHRNVKPNNVLLAQRDGREDFVRLVDFGVGELAPIGPRTRLPDDSPWVGSAEYVAPEQAMGDATDERTDVYAVGTLLYEMLTGRPPFVSGTPSATLKRVVYEKPLPLRFHTTSQAVSEDVEAVVMRALSKTPGGRFATMEDLRRAIEHVAGLQAPEFPPATMMAGGMQTAVDMHVPPRPAGTDAAFDDRMETTLIPSVGGTTTPVTEPGRMTTPVTEQSRMPSPYPGVVVEGRGPLADERGVTVPIGRQPEPETLRREAPAAPFDEEPTAPTAPTGEPEPLQVDLGEQETVVVPSVVLPAPVPPEPEPELTPEPTPRPATPRPATPQPATPQPATTIQAGEGLRGLVEAREPEPSREPSPVPPEKVDPGWDDLDIDLSDEPEAQADSHYGWEMRAVDAQAEVSTDSMAAVRAARAEEEAKKAEEQARKAEEEARRAEEQARRAEEETRRVEEQARRRAEEEAHRAEEEARRKADEARRAEEEVRRKAEEERQRADGEARREAEEEAQRAEDEARRKAEEARQAEEEARRAEEEARRAEDEARREAEEEVRRAEGEARTKAEEPRQAEEEARRAGEQAEEADAQEPEADDDLAPVAELRAFSPADVETEKEGGSRGSDEWFLESSYEMSALEAEQYGDDDGGTILGLSRTSFVTVAVVGVVGLVFAGLLARSWNAAPTDEEAEETAGPPGEEPATGGPPSAAAARLPDLLRKAERALGAGHYVDPPGNNLRELLDEIKGLDPVNPQARDLEREAVDDLQARASGASRSGDAAAAKDLYGKLTRFTPWDPVARAELAKAEAALAEKAPAKEGAAVEAQPEAAPKEDSPFAIAAAEPEPAPEAAPTPPPKPERPAAAPVRRKPERAKPPPRRRPKPPPPPKVKPKPEPKPDPKPSAAGAKEAKRLVRDGRQLLRNAQFSEAQRVFGQAIRANPRSASAHAGLGEVLFQMGRFADAVKYQKRAIALDRNNSRYHTNLANAYYKLREYARAINHWKKALEIDPSNSLARSYIRIAQQKLNRGQ